MRVVFSIIVAACVGVLAQPRPAQAIGCITGGLAGAAAGHLANHGILGAIGGCIAGHEYNKRQKRQVEQQQYQQQQDNNNRGSQWNTPNRY